MSRRLQRPTQLGGLLLAFTVITRPGGSEAQSTVTPRLAQAPGAPLLPSGSLHQQVEALRQLRTRKQGRRVPAAQPQEARPLPEASPREKAPAPRLGTLYVSASGYTSDGKRYMVRRIEVAEENHGKEWSASWDRYESKRELACREATLGKRITIKIKWKCKEGRSERNDWTRTFTTSGQTESFWRP